VKFKKKTSTIISQSWVMRKAIDKTWSSGRRSYLPSNHYS